VYAFGIVLDLLTNLSLLYDWNNFESKSVLGKIVLYTGTESTKEKELSNNIT
jgi:hypothetical protein